MVMCDNEGHTDYWPAPCANTAVIRYDGQNLCAECADEGVLALYRNLKQLQDSSKWTWDEVDDALAMLTPKEDS